MARLTVTEAAKAHIRDVLSRHPHTRPVLTIFYVPKQKDVRRGSMGDVVWNTIPDEWKAGVFDWDVIPHDFFNQPVQWETLEISVTSQVEEFTGQLVVDCLNDELHVDAIAI